MATSVPETNDNNVIFSTGQSEIERLELQHKLISDSLGRLIYAPIDLSKPGLSILDQATGSGAWLRSIRIVSPAQHTYVGTDIEDAYFPSNPPADTTYHHQSMTQPWPADWAATFDLVHSRLALPGAGTNSIRDVVHNLTALVKPGGYIQLIEMHYGDWDGGPALQKFRNGTKELFSTVTGGKGVNLREDTNSWLREEGLLDVEDKVLNVKLGQRAEGESLKRISVESVVGTASKLAEAATKIPLRGSSEGELENLPENLKQELEKVGGEFKIFAIWGRKPL